LEALDAKWSTVERRRGQALAFGRWTVLALGLSAAPARAYEGIPVAAPSSSVPTTNAADAESKSEPAPLPEPRPQAKVAKAESKPAAVVSAPRASATPRPSASAGIGSAKPIEVRLQESVVLRLRAGYGAQSAEQRARAAEEALRSASENAAPEDVRVEQQADVAVIFVGKQPVLQLYPRDAELAQDATLEVHAAQAAAQIREAMRSEQKRSAIHGTVLSLALVICTGLLALYLIRKAGDLMRRARNFIHDNPERIPALRFQSIEVVRPSLLRSGLLLTLSFGKWIVQLGIAYGWLVFSLSLFAATQAYTESLTGFVIAPISQLFGRFAASLPVLLVAGIAGVAVYVLVRFVGLFFAGVARGETMLPWLPADLATPTSLLLRAGIVVGAFVFGAPVVTGDPEGAMARSGSIVLAALALASTPLLACSVTGTVAVFLRRLRVGEFAEFGGRRGRVMAIGLLDVRLEDADGCEVRVPHLLSLLHPTRLLGRAPRIGVELSVALSTAQPDLRELLLRAASGLGEEPRVDVLGIEPDLIRLRVSVNATNPLATQALQTRILEVLAGSKPATVRARSSFSKPL
jgi:small-conductance mechanosensitive channel